MQEDRTGDLKRKEEASDQKLKKQWTLKGTPSARIRRWTAGKTEDAAAAVKRRCFEVAAPEAAAHVDAAHDTAAASGSAPGSHAWAKERRLSWLLVQTK